ncbi:uncharacterized protein LODBEIA_P45530 [Lodderomyces beijingensis]|uniref:AAA+ ATPase domain-containing protein n=1 Tax=Lodderomyces beijingensis TaxID=1775926 RepID=A0ABP0ZQB5_9ASCO
MLKSSLRPILWRSRGLSLHARLRVPLFSYPQLAKRQFHAATSLFQQSYDSKKYEQELERLFTNFDADLLKKPSSYKLTISLPSDPLNVKYISRLHAMYQIVLQEFEARCDKYEKSKDYKNVLDPDESIKEIAHTFAVNFSDKSPLEKDEIMEAVKNFYLLSNQIAYFDEMKVQDPKVQNLIKIFNDKLVGNERVDLEDVARETELDVDVAKLWFDIFSMLNSTKISSKGRRSFELTPPDYEFCKKIAKLSESVLKETKSGPASIDKSDIAANFNKFFYTRKDEGRVQSKQERDQSEQDKGKDQPGEEKDQPKKDSPKGRKPRKETVFEMSIDPKQAMQIALFSLLAIVLLTYVTNDESHEITFQSFVADYLSKNMVSKVVVVNNNVAYVELNDNGMRQTHANKLYFNIGSVETFERNLREAQDKCNIAPQMRVPVVYTTRGNTTKFLINFLPTILFLGAIYWMTKKAASSMGGMGPMGFGKSTAKKFNQETEVKTKFKDVAGMAEAKQEVTEFVSFLKNPEKYEKLGAKIPRGAILSGPPGTGKTLLAKATAGEAGVPFFSVSGSEFVEMFVGVGASRVRDLFKTARENAPSIVFVDEIDAIGKQRAKGNASSSNDERETTLNQLLVEMDGFDTTDHVVVLAGTNRPDILDKALLRPGRFDRHVHIDNPELLGRKEIFDVHLRKITLKKDIDRDLSGRLAALTPGFSGADIANVCNEAALIAARYNATSVTLRHFELAIERVIGGVEKKSKLLNPEEQKIVAFHEAGHAICGWFLRHAHPLLKVSIIPRGQGTLGYAQYLPPDQYLMSDAQLIDRMIMTLGGRVSEELNFASVTSGAHDDFKKVTGIAQSMVLRFGMSPEIGMMNYFDTRSQDDLTKPFSEETSRKIDGEVQRIVTECYNKCKQLLTEKAKEVDLVAQELLKKEFITREDMIRLLGKRPFPENNDAFDKYLDGNAAFKDEKPADERKDGEQKNKEDEN